MGADTEGTTYCKMYADLSDEAKPVVKRAGLASEDVCQQIVDAENRWAPMAWAAMTSSPSSSRSTRTSLTPAR